MADLLERLEKATGPDTALDAAIVAELHDSIVKPYPPTDDFGPKNRWQFWSRDGKHFLSNESKWPVLPYTASFDAALTLIPKNWSGWMVADTNMSEAWNHAEARVSLNSCNNLLVARGATPVIALCIAILKARELKIKMKPDIGLGTDDAGD